MAIDLGPPAPSPAPRGAADSDDLASLGYDQQLHRSLGPFASFAAGFSFVSILTTVFQLFAFGFSFGGPAFIWTWPIVFVGQFSVALIFAELSSRYPISGSIYQWSRRISNDVVGWFAGWFMLIGYIVSVSAIAIALQTVLPSVWTGFQLVSGSSALTSKSGATNAILIGSIVIVISTVIGNIGVGIMSRERASGTQFSLGRLGLPINIIAVIFGAFFLVDIGWPRAVVYGSTGYLHYFSLLFVGGCAALGIISYLRISRRSTSEVVQVEEETDLGFDPA
jgi:amino acid transporter